VLVSGAKCSWSSNRSKVICSTCRDAVITATISAVNLGHAVLWAQHQLLAWQTAQHTATCHSPPGTQDRCHSNSQLHFIAVQQRTLAGAVVHGQIDALSDAPSQLACGQTLQVPDEVGARECEAMAAWQWWRISSGPQQSGLCHEAAALQLLTSHKASLISSCTKLRPAAADQTPRPPTWQAVARVRVIAEAVGALHHLHRAALPHLAHGSQLAANGKQLEHGGQAGWRWSRGGWLRSCLRHLPMSARRPAALLCILRSCTAKHPLAVLQANNHKLPHLTVTPSRAQASWKPCSAASPSRHSCSARSSWRPSVSTGRYVHTCRNGVASGTVSNEADALGRRRRVKGAMRVSQACCRPAAGTLRQRHGCCPGNAQLDGI